MKFADRIVKIPVSKLTTCLHSFGAEGVCNTRQMITSIMKKRKGKIFVQPGSVKRKKTSNGSKSKQSEGLIAKKNLFQKTASKQKRFHRFAENVRRNEPVANKARRSMFTKTRVYQR